MQKISTSIGKPLLMKVNKFITASIIAQVVYDANVVARTQYKQVIGVGFGYKF